jgi:hypothetical protein
LTILPRVTTAEKSADESPAVLEERELERLHREGYETYPVEPDEFSN